MPKAEDTVVRKEEKFIIDKALNPIVIAAITRSSLGLRGGEKPIRRGRLSPPGLIGKIAKTSASCHLDTRMNLAEAGRALTTILLAAVMTMAKVVEAEAEKPLIGVEIIKMSAEEVGAETLSTGLATIRRAEVRSKAYRSTSLYCPMEGPETPSGLGCYGVSLI